jgi:hypothetical protein
MKPPTPLSAAPGAEQNPGGVPDLSMEATMQRELAELGAWLSAHGIDPRAEHSPEDEGSRDRLYWRYGYFVGLKRALMMLTSGGATLH